MVHIAEMRISARISTGAIELAMLGGAKEVRKTFRGSSVVERLAVEKVHWYTQVCMPEKRTYADRAEYLKKAVSEWRKKLREMAL